jgi:hypothetical protein
MLQMSVAKSWEVHRKGKPNRGGISIEFFIWSPEDHVASVVLNIARSK